MSRTFTAILLLCFIFNICASGLGRLRLAVRSANLEQKLEDYNTVMRSCGQLRRRLVAMPLSERFEGVVGSFSKGSELEGDKMSLPRSLFVQVLEGKFEIPWQFVVEANVDDEARDTYVRNEEEDRKRYNSKTYSSDKKNDTRRVLYGSVLDFRSPENFVFLPPWMFNTLGIAPKDIVTVQWHRLPEGTSIRLKPLQRDFTKLSNNRAVLEKSLKHYSALTLGSVIPIVHLSRKYYLEVVELRSASGSLYDGVCIQDCDVSTELDEKTSSSR